MSIIKEPYELSLWEDILIIRYEDGQTTTGVIESGHGEVVAQYYDEQKICVIGSDTMDTPIRATQPKLVSKINGENILTFNMYSHYYDEETEQYLENPYIGYLINERKIKLRHGAPGRAIWYDLIIKNIQENSETKTYTYTAKDLFINELSKSGFNLVFDSELENNTGNIEYLGAQVLKDSDWELKTNDEILKQFVNEPLYVIKLKNAIVAKNLEKESEELRLTEGSIIYGFYYNITNQIPFFQFLYSEELVPPIDEDNYIVGSPNWFLDGVKYLSDGRPDFATSMAISDKYRGRRLARKAAITYDSVLDKYVNIYLDPQDNKSQIYGFTETEYISPVTVRSYVTNGNNYESTNGWDVSGKKNGDGATVFPDLKVVTIPNIKNINPSLLGDIKFTSCLEFQADEGQMIYNSGIMDHRHQIKEFTKGKSYILKVNYGMVTDVNPDKLIAPSRDLGFSIAEYTINEGIYSFKDEDKLFSGTIIHNARSMEYQIEVECLKSLSYNEMIKKKIGLFFWINTKIRARIFLTNIQFFPKVESEGNIIYPDQEEIKARIKTKYYYYRPDSDYKDREDIKFLYEGYSPAGYVEFYQNSGFEKIRSITASESNRFNLIQELSEIFECWPKFEIEHDPYTGKIELDDNYRQKKWVSFHEYIINENYSGFKYGVNLKSIQRTIDSDTIVSKLIVKNNSNEFATDGFCSIARASENPSGENFILDFSYYIQQGLIGISEITNDLYLDELGYLGYYKKLRKINSDRDKYIKEQSGLLGDIIEYEAQLKTYSTALDEAKKQESNKLQEIRNTTGFTFEALMKDKANSWWNQEKAINIMQSIARLKALITNYQNLVDSANNKLIAAKERSEYLERILTSKEESQNGESRLLLEKQLLHEAFYKKYSRFLQEGSWISEDYIDDNLYFLDAQSTLFTSGKPKISYNINVLELSQLEGYENYSFALGDKTTMEDTEFFGWKDDGTTPYQEEIVVTQLTINFDSPEQNQIKVQNYRTQFEDLFQRITATTQAIEYSTGKYKKVAGVVKEDGTIKIETLQNSIINNALTLQNAKDQTVIWDDTGITTISAKDPANIVRIVNGGIFLSRDGGINWRTGITGEGINADYIVTGHLNTDEISIYADGFPSFRWDKTGLNAYYYELDNNNTPCNFNYGKYVRFDQFGIYGIQNISDFNPQEEDEDGTVGIDKIFNKANFALTWDGFSIKTQDINNKGYVRITNKNDFELINVNSNNEEITQIKIGRLSEDNGPNVYGIRICDLDGHPVMEQDSTGRLWIREELHIGTEETSTVKIGYLDRVNEATGAHEVINAGDNNSFIVYEDGSFVSQGGIFTNGYFEGDVYANNGIFNGVIHATGGEFTGTINATGGQIGGVSIGTLINGIYDVDIEVTGGTVFKYAGENVTKTLTAILYQRGNKISEEELQSRGATYQWYKGEELLEGENKKQLIVRQTDIGDTGTALYSCKITMLTESEEDVN